MKSKVDDCNISFWRTVHVLKWCLKLRGAYAYTDVFFRCVVARDSSNLETMKFVLQGLCCDWVPDMELLYKPQSDHPTPLPPRISISSADLSGLFRLHVDQIWDI